MARDFDVVVLGLGGIGSGAAYWLAKHGSVSVLGLEQFELGHVRGESQDHSRIIRLSYHAPHYVRLAKRAYDSWAALEADSGSRLVLKTGGLDLGPRDGAIPLLGYADSMNACGVDFERLDAAEIMRRWPQFTLTDDIEGLFQADGGIAMAARANDAHRRMARAHGAVLRDNAPVEHITERDDEIDIRAGGTTYRCGKLVIAAGPWTNRALANFDIRIPLEVTKEQVTYFAAPDVAAFAPERFPVWIWMDDPSFYGFPAFGEAGPKVAQDAGGKAVDPDTRSFEPDAENFARVQAFLRSRLPSALGPVIYTKTCLYTLTPDRDFVIDLVPGHPNIAFAIGAGHAFKFASVIGRILAELVTAKGTASEIDAFCAGREILAMADPPKSYMV
ncbi:MAG TPA: N-methyl-L-tryptophan oxidase [Candidatus Eremiobacteraceae bacterium]|nr:N-methyl-L-tryptophan oxidase [Candidatus Eremiobacteraceae bacterium]